jgi:glycosyltransferase involved in cell wall biosynthesis
MKRLLLITAFTPSRSTAGQHYTLNLLQDVSSRYQVDVVYFKYKDEEYVAANDNIHVLEGYSLTAFDRLKNYLQHPFIHPVFSSRFNYAILQKLKDLIQKNNYDILYFDFSQVFIYSEFIDHPYKILMAHDVLYQKYHRQGFYPERQWIYKSEKRLIEKGTLQTFSVKDQALIKRLYQRDAEVVHFYLSPQIMQLDLTTVRQENYFCFLGAWHRPENSEGLKWFVDNVLPHTGTASYIILGPNLPRSISAAIKGNSRVRYLGFVDNPYTYIARSKALIAPLFKGAGIKVKVVESLCCGTPVLGTSVALEGIPDVAGNMIKCNHAVEFTAAILSFDIPAERKTAFRNLFLKFYNGIRKTTL